MRCVIYSVAYHCGNMDVRFSGYCPTCVNRDYCFQHEICLRRNMSNEFDDEDNVADGSELNSSSALTEKSTYSVHENNAHKD